jgi:DNA-binding MarR family transcriptional regulator
VATNPPTPGTTAVRTDPIEVAGRLRQSAFRLTRVLRQQDDSGHAPALLSALAVVDREGPLTLGALAAQEQVSPPTITKIVDGLEARGFVERARDDNDRRVWRVRVTARGRRELQTRRAQRTEWLAAQLRGLAPDDLDRLGGALDVLERLTTATPRAVP